MKFHAIIQLAGKTATGISVPEEVVAGLEAGKKPAVKVTIGSYSYRSTIASMNGEYKLPISAEHRAGAGVEAGDVVEVSLELDTAPREVELPANFAAALAQEPAAQKFFDSLSYSNKRRIVIPIADAKSDETRQRRIDKAIGLLKESKMP